jgi:hypothetical protein
MGLEMYPIDNPAENEFENEVNFFGKEEELLQNEKVCSEFQSANTKNIPWFALVQAFNWANYPEGKHQNILKAAYPTPDELRNIVYAGLINGAKGVLYYEWHNPGEAINGIVYNAVYKLFENNELWNEVRILNVELKILKDVYMSGDRTKLLCDNEWITASYWTFKDAIYVIVANLHRTQAQPFSYAINVAGKLSNVFKYRKVTLSYAEGKLMGNIPARQIQVCKIM